MRAAPAATSVRARLSGVIPTLATTRLAFGMVSLAVTAVCVYVVVRRYPDFPVPPWLAAIGVPVLLVALYGVTATYERREDKKMADMAHALLDAGEFNRATVYIDYMIDACAKLEGHNGPTVEYWRGRRTFARHEMASKQMEPWHRLVDGLSSQIDDIVQKRGERGSPPK